MIYAIYHWYTIDISLIYHWYTIDIPLISWYIYIWWILPILYTTHIVLSCRFSLPSPGAKWRPKNPFGNRWAYGRLPVVGMVHINMYIYIYICIKIKKWYLENGHIVNGDYLNLRATLYLWEANNCSRKLARVLAGCRKSGSLNIQWSISPICSMYGISTNIP